MTLTVSNAKRWILALLKWTVARCYRTPNKETPVSLESISHPLMVRWIVSLFEQTVEEGADGDLVENFPDWYQKSSDEAIARHWYEVGIYLWANKRRFIKHLNREKWSHSMNPTKAMNPRRAAFLNIVISILFAAAIVFSDYLLEGTPFNQTVKYSLLAVLFIPFSLLSTIAGIKNE